MGNAPIPKKKLIKALSVNAIVVMFNTSCECYSNFLKDVMRDGEKTYGLKQCVKHFNVSGES
jgi:hypothetical protein